MRGAKEAELVQHEEKKKKKRMGESLNFFNKKSENHLDS
jgi:hypothetical protein